MLVKDQPQPSESQTNGLSPGNGTFDFSLPTTSTTKINDL